MVVRLRIPSSDQNSSGSFPQHVLEVPQGGQVKLFCSDHNSSRSFTHDSLELSHGGQIEDSLLRPEQQRKLRP